MGDVTTKEEDEETSSPSIDEQLEKLQAVLDDQPWVDETDIDDDLPLLTVVSESVPDLRAVYKAAEAVDVQKGVVAVASPGQTWKVTVRDGEVSDVERHSGDYTINRMSSIEKLFQTIATTGMLVALMMLVTLAVGLFFEVPFSGTHSLLGLGIGVVLAVGGIIGYSASPGMSQGATSGTPGDNLQGFEKLSKTVKTALVAYDDAKSSYNEQAVWNRMTLPAMLIVLAGVAYFFVLAYVAFGAIGVLIVGGLATLKALFGVWAARVMGTYFDELDDDRANELLDEIHDQTDHEPRPTIRTYGDDDSPVYKQIPMAVPMKDAIILSRADAGQLHDDELASVLAHEYKHVASHRPSRLGWLLLGSYLVPGIVLLAMPELSPSPLEFGAAVWGYIGLLRVGTALRLRQWEQEADDFAIDHAPPMGLVYGLTRISRRHVIDAEDETLLADNLDAMFNSHPLTHHRIERVLEHEID